MSPSELFLHNLDGLPVICCDAMLVCSLVFAALEIEKDAVARRTVARDMQAGNAETVLQILPSEKS